ncbi:MAG: DMT family transporter [Oligoflexus sp.]
MPPVLLLLCGALCISFAPIFVKMVDAAPSVSAWYRVFLGGNILLLWGSGILVRQNRQGEVARGQVTTPFLRWPKMKRWFLWCLGSGFFFALDLAMWHQSIIYSGAGISTFLANLNVFYLTFFGVVFFREKLSLRYALFTGGALLGTLLLIDIKALTGWSEHYAWGIFLGFLTGMAYSGFILCLRQAESAARDLNLARPMTLGCSSMATALFLSILIIFSQSSFAVDAQDFAILLTLALVAQVMGWSLISRALPALQVSISGLLLLLQPVMAAIWAALWFDEFWNFWQITGATLTLACIYGGNIEAQKSRQLDQS